MTDSMPRGDAAVLRQRTDLADTKTRRRKKTDSIRVEQRELQDLSRRAGQRGDGQAHDALRRQRAAEDRGVRDERESADISLDSEHALADATLAREKDARSDAEGESRRSTDREALRTAELEETLILLEDQLLGVSRNLSSMLEGCPRGPYEERLSVNVGRVRVATERMQTLLRAVMVPPSQRPKHDSKGGSG